MIIGIDGSTRATGYACGGVKDGSPRGGVWSLPGADDFSLDTTLARVSQSISDLCRLVKPDFIFIEAPLILVGSQNAAHTTSALIQLTGAMRAAATRAGAKVELAAVSTVRKYFIGQGNLNRAAAKAAVMARCKLLGWEINGDDNRADACAVWAYGMARKYPQWAPRSTPLFGRVAG